MSIRIFRYQRDMTVQSSYLPWYNPIRSSLASWSPLLLHHLITLSLHDIIAERLW